MHTIADLNKKWWYRLIKVFYLLTFALFVITSILLVWTSYPRQFDSSKSYIVCNDGRTMTPSLLLINHIDLYDYSYAFGFVSDDDAYKVRLYCASDDDITQMVHSAYPTTQNTLDSKTEANLVRSDLSEFAQKIQVNTDNYKIIEVDTPREWLAIILFSFLSAIVICVLFEIIRRVFYYIVLGSIRPKKL